MAILTLEPEADTFVNLIAEADSVRTSAIAIFEAALAIARKNRATVEEAERDVRDFIVTGGIEIVPVTDADATRALAAFARYGKGCSHPAKLNMGDCFAYALAQGYGASLLFKGQDFGQTDIESALRP